MDPRDSHYPRRRASSRARCLSDTRLLFLAPAERDPALAQLAAAAVSGLAPAGPELRRRPVEVAFDGRPGVVVSAPLSVREAGFSLHAATRAGAADEQGREALLKYDPWKSPTGDILRPPLSTERLLPGPDGLVRIALKKPFSDGTVAVDLDPLSLLCRLVALVPAPRFHTVRYSGVLAAASKWRPLIVPKQDRAGQTALAPSSEQQPCDPSADRCDPPAPSRTKRLGFRFALTA